MASAPVVSHAIMHCSSLMLCVYVICNAGQLWQNLLLGKSENEVCTVSSHVVQYSSLEERSLRCSMDECYRRSSDL